MKSVTESSPVRIAPGHVVEPAATDNPSDPATREELIWRMTDEAIARYHEAKRMVSLAYRLDDISGSLSNPWSVLAGYHVCNAEGDVIDVIRAHDPAVREVDLSRCRYKRWEPRGVKLGGKLYLAIPNPDSDEVTDSDYWIMRLVVVDPANIVDMDTPEKSL